MNRQELEDLVRDSLQARADDIESTPELWREVESRAQRRRWRSRFAWLGGAIAAAAIAVLAVVVVPGSLPDDDVPTILDPGEEQPQEPDVEPDPSDPAEEDPDPAEELPADEPNLPAGVPAAYVATAGFNITMYSTGLGHELVGVQVAESGETVTAVAVRPGSTPQDATVAFHLARNDGGHALGYLVIRDWTTDVRWFADHGQQYEVSGDTAPGALPRPIWSPDGDAITWVEQPADEQAAGPRLRIIGWDDGPGTGETATDNTSFELDELPSTAVGADAWARFGEPGMPTDRSAIFLTSREMEAWNVVLERQPDGGYGLITTNLIEHPAGTALAFAAEPAEDGPRPAYVVLAHDDPGHAPRLSVFDDPGHQELPLDDGALSDPTDPLWVSGARHHVLVGDGERAWITSRPDGFRRSVAGMVRHADWVR